MPRKSLELYVSFSILFQLFQNSTFKFFFDQSKHEKTPMDDLNNGSIKMINMDRSKTKKKVSILQLLKHKIFTLKIAFTHKKKSSFFTRNNSSSINFNFQKRSCCRYAILTSHYDILRQILILSLEHRTATKDDDENGCCSYCHFT